MLNAGNINVRYIREKRTSNAVKLSDWKSTKKRSYDSFLNPFGLTQDNCRYEYYWIMAGYYSNLLKSIEIDIDIQSSASKLSKEKSTAGQRTYGRYAYNLCGKPQEFWN